MKLYCECFANNEYCNEECGCEECYNQPKYKDLKELVKGEILYRNPFAFKDKYKEV